MRFRVATLDSDSNRDSESSRSRLGCVTPTRFGIRSKKEDSETLVQIQGYPLDENTDNEFFPMSFCAMSVFNRLFFLRISLLSFLTDNYDKLLFVELLVISKHPMTSRLVTTCHKVLSFHVTWRLGSKGSTL